MSREAMYERLLRKVALLPKRMLSLYDFRLPHSLPEFILHDLCDSDFFNIKRAAFLVDNPDFDYVQGIAGFANEEKYQNGKKVCCHWEDADAFSKHMERCKYNQLVKSFCKCSLKKKNRPQEDFLIECARDLGFENPSLCVWDLKHYNHGVLLFDHDGQLDNDIKDHFVNIAYLLSFVPLN